MTEDTKITPDEHSDVVGGSTAGRVLACPGSVRLRQQVKKAHMARILDMLIKDQGLAPSLASDFENVLIIPDAVRETMEGIYREETTSKYAKEGTGLHEAMAWLLESDEEPESAIDREFEGVYITPELFRECISPAFDQFDEYLDRIAEEDGEEPVFVVEKSCQMPGIPGAFGTSDVIGKTSKRIFIPDWKFGGGVRVSPVDNPQGKFYGRSACFTMKDWLGFPIDEKTGMFSRDLPVDIVIIQPRIESDEPNYWSTTFGDLEDFRNELIAAVSEATNDENARVKKGDHCKFCEAEHICPAKQQLAQRITERVNDVYEKLDTEGTPTVDEKGEFISVSKAMTAADVQFTPQQLADWLEDAADIKAWCDHVRSLAFTELEAGREVVGKELDQGLGNSAWMIEDRLVDQRLGRYGLAVDIRRVSSPISPTVARKEIKKLEDPKKAELLEKIIHRPPSKVKMVKKGTAKNPVKPHSETLASVGEKLKEHIAE